MMKVVILSLIGMQLWSGVCQAQEATYAYTGEVAEADGLDAFIPIGSTISGTFTIDYNALSPDLPLSFVFGTIGTDSYQASIFGGAIFNVSGAVPLVFSSTAQVDGVSYMTSIPLQSTYYVNSTIYTYPDGVGGDSFNAIENTGQTPGAPTVFSGFAIYNNGPGLPVDSDGFPVLPGNNINGTGGFFGAYNQDGTVAYQVLYNFDSLTLTSYLPPTSVVPSVPEPPTTAMVLFGGAALIRLARRRRRGLTLPL